MAYQPSLATDSEAVVEKMTAASETAIRFGIMTSVCRATECASGDQRQAIIFLKTNNVERGQLLCVSDV